MRAARSTQVVLFVLACSSVVVGVATGDYGYAHTYIAAALVVGVLAERDREGQG